MKKANFFGKIYLKMESVIILIVKIKIRIFRIKEVLGKSQSILRSVLGLVLRTVIILNIGFKNL